MFVIIKRLNTYNLFKNDFVHLISWYKNMVLPINIYLFGNYFSN